MFVEENVFVFLILSQMSFRSFKWKIPINDMKMTRLFFFFNLIILVKSHVLNPLRFTNNKLVYIVV